jgi:hypothetical protein
MRTATITIQIDTSDAPMSEADAADALAHVVDSLADITYVSSAYLNPAPASAPVRKTPCYCDSAYHPEGH